MVLHFDPFDVLPFLVRFLSLSDFINLRLTFPMSFPGDNAALCYPYEVNITGKLDEEPSYCLSRGSENMLVHLELCTGFTSLVLDCNNKFDWSVVVIPNAKWLISLEIRCDLAYCLTPFPLKIKLDDCLTLIPLRIKLDLLKKLCVNNWSSGMNCLRCPIIEELTIMSPLTTNLEQYEEMSEDEEEDQKEEQEKDSEEDREEYQVHHFIYKHRKLIRRLTVSKEWFRQGFRVIHPIRYLRELVVICSNWAFYCECHRARDSNVVNFRFLELEIPLMDYDNLPQSFQFQLIDAAIPAAPSIPDKLPRNFCSVGADDSSHLWQIRNPLLELYRIYETLNTVTFDVSEEDNLRFLLIDDILYTLQLNFGRSLRHRRIRAEFRMQYEYPFVKGLHVADITRPTLEIMAVIQGTPDSPYETGLFRILIKVPPGYPHDLPEFSFITKVWHPNISISNDTKGVMGLSQDLRENYWPGVHLCDALLQIQVAIGQPSDERILNNEAHNMYSIDKAAFNFKARCWTKHYAGGAPFTSEEKLKMIDMLTQMGYQEEDVQKSLKAKKYNIDLALEQLNSSSNSFQN